MIFTWIMCAAPLAQAQDEARVFAPTSAWLVGPASLAANIGNISSKIPCVVANQFSNGFVMRFSGGGGKLMALAIDFRQKAFTPPHRYDVEFSVPGQFFQIVNAAAYDEGTLIFNLQKLPDFYSAIKKAETVVVKVGGRSVTFALIGLDDGFERMETCYNPSIHGPAPLAPPIGPQPTPETVKMPTAKRESAKEKSIQNPLIAQDAGLTPMPDDQVPSPAGAALPPDTDEAAMALMEKARQAEAAARDLAGRSPQKKQPAPPAGTAMAADWSSGKQMRSPADIIVNNGDGGQQSSEMHWRALKGANLRQVLDAWTRNTGVQFIWSADQDFAVQRSLSFQGTFDAAVKALLAEYDGQSSRPKGRIYQQPGTGKPVLVIELETAPTNHFSE
jgi:hypothetical protein